MAMTKAEKAEMDRLRNTLALALALRWSGSTEPQRVGPPENGHFNGWDFNVHTQRVEEYWSTSRAHGRGRYTGRDIHAASRNGQALYATERDALIGLRLAMEREAAAALAKVDVLIEAATP